MLKLRRRTVWHGGAAAIAAGLLLAGCGDGGGGGGSASPTTVPNTAPTPTPTTSAAATATTVAASTPPTTPVDPPVGTADSCRTTNTSSRADFDPGSGQYAALLYEVDVSRQVVSFDIIQWLTGDDANRAQQAASPDGPPFAANDYFTVNAFVHTDEAAVRSGARVRLLTSPLNTSLALGPAALADIATRPILSRHPGMGIFWLSFDGGEVTDICQQYTP